MRGARTRSGGGLALLVAAGALALAGACGKTSGQNNSGAGAAGTLATGGESANAGMPGTSVNGGASFSGQAGTGIGLAGGSPGDAGAPSAGAAGSGTGTPCVTGTDCGQGFCRSPDQTCVECLLPSNCADNQTCLAGSCVGTIACVGDTDCPAGKRCDPTWHRCLGCVEDADCGAASACVSGQCTPFAPCKNSLDCAVGVCDKALGKCVECVMSSDCQSDERCAEAHCVSAPTCASDIDCKASHMLCDPGLGECVQCLANADCPTLHHCASGVCEPDSCEPGKSVCVADAVAKCNAAGDGVGNASPCTNSEHCGYSSGNAQCGSCTKRPVDVLWAIDNGGEMADQPLAYGAVIDQVHQALKKQGIDIRTVLVSNPDPTPNPYCFPGRGVCVPAPTGAEACPGQTSEFLHVGHFVGTDPLKALLDSYSSWQPFLRADAQKVFLIVANDSDIEITTAMAFTTAVAALTPPLGNTWTVSGVVCSGSTCNAPMLQCSPASAQARCLGGVPFVSLVKQTGGFAVDFCTTDPAVAAAPITAGISSAVTPPGCP